MMPKPKPATIYLHPIARMGKEVAVLDITADFLLAQLGHAIYEASSSVDLLGRIIPLDSQGPIYRLRESIKLMAEDLTALRDQAVSNDR